MIDKTGMRDGDMPLPERIEAAQKRIEYGHSARRIPVEATDIDIVLSDCSREITRLRAELAERDAEIDRLRLEHEPESMTPEAMAEWDALRKVVEVVANKRWFLDHVGGECTFEGSPMVQIGHVEELVEMAESALRDKEGT